VQETWYILTLKTNSAKVVRLSCIFWFVTVAVSFDLQLYEMFIYPSSFIDHYVLVH